MFTLTNNMLRKWDERHLKNEPIHGRKGMTLSLSDAGMSIYN